MVQEAIMLSLIQHFEADFLWKNPQNPEFRNNPENFHPCKCLVIKSHQGLYCKFRNFRKNFILVNRVKRHICHIKTSQLEHDLTTSVNNRVIVPFARVLFSRESAKVCDNKTIAKFFGFTVTMVSSSNE